MSNDNVFALKNPGLELIAKFITGVQFKNGVDVHDQNHQKAAA